MQQRVGITTTVPIEIILASRKCAVDLNNIFISSDNKGEYIDYAENIGFPRNFCAWTKALYGVIKKEGIDTVVGVVEGDCSSTKALTDILRFDNIKIIPFAYPYDRDPVKLHALLEKFMEVFGVDWDDVYKVHKNLGPVRKLVYELDEISHKTNLIKSFDSHYWQVSCSDFRGDVSKFHTDLKDYIKEHGSKEGCDEKKTGPFKRLGFLGVPPIIPEIYDFIDETGGRVVFQEIQRQFSFPYLNGKDIDFKNFKEEYIKQYLNYTYPYDVFMRLEDIKKEIQKRQINGLIHYVQSFCHRQVDDIVLRNELDIPILTLEEDRPGKLSNRSKIRIEAFMYRNFKVSDGKRTIKRKKEIKKEAKGLHH